MDDKQSTTLPRYEPPRLRELGPVAVLTQGGIAGARSDGILFAEPGGGRIVRTS
ncbi:MAG: lasso RiPP family leader peptide-containing protein [Chloroflexota bacterium]|nr:lasso RiPP family leader peptide-containing protein [Chloroflexota bacterium]